MRRGSQQTAPGSSKMHENLPPRSSKSVQKEAQSDSASEEAFEPQFSCKFVIFERFLASQMEAKSKKKRLKCDIKKQYIFQVIFNKIVFALASKNGAKIQCFSHLY